MPGFSIRIRDSKSDHIFQAFQGGNLNNFRCRFCLEHHFLACEWVGTLSRLSGWLLHNAHLQQTGDREQARCAASAKILLNLAVK